MRAGLMFNGVVVVSATSVALASRDDDEVENAFRRRGEIGVELAAVKVTGSLHSGRTACRDKVILGGQRSWIVGLRGRWQRNTCHCTESDASECAFLAPPISFLR